MVHLIERNYERDTVYLYQFPGSSTASSMSPYCIKVEAFCRLHNLKVMRRYTTTARGKNKKLPMIELNGEQIADSQIILRRLAQHFNLKVYPDPLTAGLGHSIERTLDNHTVHLLQYDQTRVITEIMRVMLTGMVPSIVRPIAVPLGAWAFKRNLLSATRDSIGRFTDDEYDELLKNDLDQLQNILGENSFLLGEEPTQVDCVALGHFGSSYYCIPSARSHINELIESAEFASLRAYLERVKQRIFGNEFCQK
ncbi:hypothetical protein PFISCL1PPCAC_12922 [Pristionchus fissidentatus]|uniref:Glutathione S-transferase n=1 Tax=Pristionchus fissidentatus TaxID=1538716 RepID=A0AAV5VSS0_9BILA|nr:hypothetical protein PFISCL1PPCAC_12922 [Pristionchus fissidentatus]